MKNKCKRREEFYKHLGAILLKESTRADALRGVNLPKRIKPQAESLEMVF